MNDLTTELAQLTAKFETDIRALALRHLATPITPRQPKPRPQPEKFGDPSTMSRADRFKYLLSSHENGWWTRDGKKFYMSHGLTIVAGVQKYMLVPHNGHIPNDALYVKFTTIISRWKFTKEIP